MITNDYISLHGEDGGAAQGFRCKVVVHWVDTKNGQAEPHFAQCSKVTRTERGMLTHLWRVHKIKRQGELFLSEQTKSEDASLHNTAKKSS